MQFRPLNRLKTNSFCCHCLSWEKIARNDMSHTLFKLLIGEQVVENTASKSIFRQFLDIASIAVIRLSVFKKHGYSVIPVYFQLIDAVHTLFGALNR